MFPAGLYLQTNTPILLISIPLKATAPHLKIAWMTSLFIQTGLECEALSCGRASPRVSADVFWGMCHAWRLIYSWSEHRDRFGSLNPFSHLWKLRGTHVTAHSVTELRRPCAVNVKSLCLADTDAEACWQLGAHLRTSGAVQCSETDGFSSWSPPGKSS